MVSKSFAAAALALAASSAVNAQTSSDCNPLLKDGCPADPALGTKVECDFTKGACEHFSELAGTTISYKDKGALFTIGKKLQAPTIRSKKYILFGKVEVVLQAAPGAGIVTSVVFQSDDLDEIDWEWIGNDAGHVQTNFFSKTRSTDYTNGQTLAVDAVTNTFHTYTIEWTSKGITWSVNGKEVRTITADAAGKKFPQTPAQVRLGTWCGGCSDQEGTRTWAGGATDFSKGPFDAYYKSVTITDYAGKDSQAKGGIKEYVYGDKSGTWQSIKIIGGESSNDSSSSSAAASATTGGSSSASAGSSSSAAAASSSAGSSGSSGSSASAAKPSFTSAPIKNNFGSPTGASNATTGTASRTSSTPTSTLARGAASRGSAAVGLTLLAGAGALLAHFL